MVQAVIFDCFGVLYNDAYKEFFAAYGPKMGGREGYYRGLGYQVDAGLLDEDVFYRELEAASGQPFAEIKADMNDTSHLNRRVVDIVRRLKPHFKIGMLSNSERHSLQKFLENGNIGHLFDVVIASSETGYAKPDPEIFQLAVRELNLKPEEILFIDDGAHNVRGAEAVGLKALLYTSAPALDADLKTVLPGY